MDCRTCDPTLIDLVHSELATDAAREAHAHLATCASCRASFETLVAATRLAAQLPLVEPPPEVATRVMQLAEQHAQEVAARQRVVAPRPTPWQALLDFVGRLATRPQVAMATIMVLIVAVGLWSLPRLRRQAATPVAGVVVNPEPEGEAAPGTGVEPAERLDLKVDMRARRIRSKDGMPLAAPEPAAVTPPAEAAPAVAPETVAERDKKAEDALAPLDDVGLGQLARKGAPAAARSGRGSASGSGPASNDAREFAKAAPPRPASSTARSEGELAQAPRAKAASVERAEPAKPKASYEERSAAEGAPASAAASAPKPAPTAQSATELLSSARSRAKSGGCSAALPEYQRLILQSPDSAEAGSALIEVAECRRAAGEIEVARSLLQRAAKIPEVAARARALLSALPARK